MSTIDATDVAPSNAEPVELPETGRRTLLKGGLLALAGLVGWKASDALSAAPAATAATSLDLEGMRMRAAGDGDGGAMSATIIDRSGAEVGSFSSTPLAAAAEGEAPGTALHSFSTPEGMIFGLGAAARGDEPATFAIVGGTGAYSGASGNYTAAHRPEHLGGDGSASWQFNFGS